MKLDIFRANVRLATSRWGKLPISTRNCLHELTEKHHLSVASGDLLYIDDHWYVSHSGLLAIARRNHCAGIQVHPVPQFCDPAMDRWAFEATVYKSKTCKGFVGYGDADPSNVSPLVRGAEMRVAETRAVNRALRKAYGVGICSFEEIGSRLAAATAEDGHSNGDGTNTLRAQLCQLVSQHKLNASRVKQYGADFCGTKTLREAGRDAVAGFIEHLRLRASADRDALTADLARYAPQPVTAEQPTSQKEVA